MDLKTLFSSFDAPLHIVLRRFKLIPILVLMFFIILTWNAHVIYMGAILSLSEWQVASMFAYMGVLIPVVKYCLDAIRLGEEVGEHDKDKEK